MAPVACTTCRGLKIKCEWTATPGICRKCISSGQECVIIPRQLGRKLGSKNKPREGRNVTSAPYPRNAIASSSSSTPPDLARSQRPSSAIQQASQSMRSQSSSKVNVAQQSYQRITPMRSRTEEPPMPNPMSVLAQEICRIYSQIPEGSSQQPAAQPFDFTSISDLFEEPSRKLDPIAGPRIVQEGLKALFTQAHSNETLSTWTRVDQPKFDLGKDYDAIVLGVVSKQEAEELFVCFFKDLLPAVRVLDPSLHTLDFVRARSSLLLAVMLQCACNYKVSSTGLGMSMYTRLGLHVKFLLGQVYTHGFRSVEICQALLLHCTWLGPTVRLGQHRIWQYVTQAISMAMELRLDAPIPFAVEYDPDCKTSDSTYHARLCRNSKRTWLFLFSSDRGLALLRGRSPMMPDTLIESERFLEGWPLNSLSLDVDRCVCASVALRQSVIFGQQEIVKLLAEDAEASSFSLVCDIADNAVSSWKTKWQGILGHFFDSYAFAVKFARFLLLVTPYEKRLVNQTLSGEARDECLLAALDLCNDQLASLRNRGQGTRYATVTADEVYSLSYTAFFSVRIMEVHGAQTDASSLEVDIFHLAILAQLAIQLQSLVPDPSTHTAASIFGGHLLVALRNLAEQKAKALALASLEEDDSVSEAPAVQQDVNMEFPFWVDAMYSQPEPLYGFDSNGFGTGGGVMMWPHL